jgi:hypothetical protein
VTSHLPRTRKLSTYVHEDVGTKEPFRRAAYKHVLGTSFATDEEIFVAGEGRNLRLHILPGRVHLGFVVTRFEKYTVTDFYFWSIGSKKGIALIVRNARYRFGPVLLEDGRILAITDRDAPNLKVVEVRRREDGEAELGILSSSPTCETSRPKLLFSTSRANRVGRVPVEKWDTVRLVGGSEDGEEIFLERESFTKPIQVCSYAVSKTELTLWAARKVPINSQRFSHTQAWFSAKDVTRIPMFLVGLREVLDGGPHAVIMTSYGGYSVPMTPQFSLFVAFSHGTGLPVCPAKYPWRFGVRNRMA